MANPSANHEYWVSYSETVDFLSEKSATQNFRIHLGPQECGECFFPLVPPWIGHCGYETPASRVWVQFSCLTNGESRLTKAWTITFRLKFASSKLEYSQTAGRAKPKPAFKIRAARVELTHIDYNFPTDHRVTTKRTSAAEARTSLSEVFYQISYLYLANDKWSIPNFCSGVASSHASHFDLSLT
jgi:hypothetical protein